MVDHGRSRILLLSRVRPHGTSQHARIVDCRMSGQKMSLILVDQGPLSMNTLGRDGPMTRPIARRLVFRLLVLVGAVQELPVHVVSNRRPSKRPGKITHLMKSASSELAALMGGMAVALLALLPPLVP